MRNKLVLLGYLFVLLHSLTLHAAPVRICDLPTITSPSSTLYLEVSDNCFGSRSIAWSNLSSLLAPTTRTITCTSPLRCAGTNSTTLASDFTLSITSSALFGFGTIATSSGTAPVADAAQDPLTLTCTAPATCTGDSTTDTVTIAVSTASTGATGVVQLAANGGTTAGQAVQASDTRLTGLSSGTYTPTITSVTNVAATSNAAGQWLRVGSTMTISGVVDIDPTSASVATSVGVSLPVSSNLGALGDCAGTDAMDNGTVITPGRVRGDATNDRLQIDFYADSGALSRTHVWIVTCKVI